CTHSSQIFEGLMLADFSQHSLSQVPSDAKDNHLAREMTAFERIRRGDRHGLLPYQTAIQKSAMEPLHISSANADRCSGGVARIIPTAAGTLIASDSPLMLSTAVSHWPRDCAP